ncbi:chorismate synthase [bacterium]|nr:chorismate synthase [bacterium]
MLRYVTSGESHGKCLHSVLEGIPSGLKLSEEDINKELARRQRGFGRGERIQKIEKDRVEITSGLRWGETIGSPITMTIINKDWENWKKLMSIYASDKEMETRMVRPRPGHADLAGALKYGREDLRDILERASARETAARVAVGAVCKRLLAEFAIKVVCMTEEIGGIQAGISNLSPEEIEKASESSAVRCPDKSAEKKMIKAIEEAEKSGDTLGGVFTVLVINPPVGLGSHTQWDLRLDGRLAQAVISIPAVKGVEIGEGFSMARKPGSKVHDEIFYEAGRGYYRKTNNSGGIEGGISNGENIIVRAAMKPLSSLKKPLKSVDMITKKEVPADVIRADICAVSSACVIGEAVVAFEIARTMREKFGGDSLKEMKSNFEHYIVELKNR